MKEIERRKMVQVYEIMLYSCNTPIGCMGRFSCGGRLLWGVRYGFERPEEQIEKFILELASLNPYDGIKHFSTKFISSESMARRAKVENA